MYGHITPPIDDPSKHSPYIVLSILVATLVNWWKSSSLPIHDTDAGNTMKSSTRITIPTKHTTTTAAATI
jgi:hypothetical protein